MATKRRRTGAEDDGYNQLEDIADAIAGRVVDDDGNLSDQDVTDEGVGRRIAFEEKNDAFFELHHDNPVTTSTGGEQLPEESGEGENNRRRGSGAEDDDYNKFEDFLDSVAGRIVDQDGNISDTDVTKEGAEKRREIEEKTGIHVEKQQATENAPHGRKRKQRQSTGAEDDDVNQFEDFVDEITGREVDMDGNISDENVTDEGLTMRHNIEENIVADKVHERSAAVGSKGATAKELNEQGVEVNNQSGNIQV